MSDIKSLKPNPPKKQPSTNSSIQRVEFRLTFSDGLNFGCGFFVAGFLFSMVFIPLTTIFVFVLIPALGLALTM